MSNKTFPKYSLAERDRRWALTRALMNQEDVDTLIVYGEHEDSGPASFSWDTWFTNGRPGSTIVFPKSGEPLELVPYHLFILDHSMAYRDGNPFWIPAKNMRLGRDSGVLKGVLEELNLEKGRVGVVGIDAAPPWHMEGLIPYQLWESILKSFPDATFVSVSDKFARMAMVLSDEELEVVRHSAAIGESMTKAMVGAAKVGSKESSVYQAASLVAHQNGTVAPGMHLFVAPENAASGPPQWTYRPYSQRTLQNGDTIHSEVFATFGQRHTQHQLTIAIGDVHADIERAGKVARECYEAGLRALQPGLQFGDVCEAMIEPVTKAGGWIRGPQIHSLNPLLALCGLSKQLADTWNEIYEAEGYPTRTEMPNFMHDLILQPGMTFAFEPSCGFGKHLVTIGGTVIVSANGAEELNPFTAQLQRVSGL